MSQRQVIVIPQGDDVRIVLDVPEVEAGDRGSAEMREWSGGPLLARFTVAVIEQTKKVVLTLPRSASSTIRRSGVFDLELQGTSGRRTERYGPAVLRPEVTTFEAPYLTWAAYRSLTWADYKTLTYGGVLMGVTTTDNGYFIIDNDDPEAPVETAHEANWVSGDAALKAHDDRITDAQAAAEASVQSDELASAIDEALEQGALADANKRNRYVDQGAPKTAPYSMAAGHRADFDASTESIVQPLPTAQLIAGDEVYVSLSAKSGTNTLTLTGPGGPFLLSVAGHGLMLMWNGTVWKELADRKTKSSLDAAYAPLGSVALRLKVFEGQPFFAYGHSYNVIGGASLFHARLASRHGTASVTNRGTAGNRMWQTLAGVRSTWTANTRGFFTVCGLINDVAEWGTAALGPATCSEALRSALAHLTASAILAYDSTAFAYTSGGWTSGATTTNGSYVDFGFTGDSAYLLVNFTSGAGSSVVVTRGGDGAQIASFTTGGYGTDFVGAVKLSGFGTGAHTVRILLVSGGSLTIVGAAMPSPTPPVGVVICEGSVLLYNGSAPGNLSEKNAALASAYIPAVQAVAANFPTVKVAVPDSNWDPTTMLLADNLHPNDKGHSYYADRVEAVMAAQPFVQGLDVLKSTTAGPAYTGSTPSYAVTGPPDPVGPLSYVSASGQIQLSWSAPANNGFAITDYVVQYRTTAGPGSWTTFADGTSTSTTATVTGLTNGTSYDFRVAAVNSVGQGAYGGNQTATPGTASVPSAPLSTSAAPFGSGAVKVNWSAPSLDGGAAITDYVVQYRTTAGPGSWTTFADGTSTSTTATVTGLTNGTSYDFRVAAVNSVGQGAYGSTATASPSANLVVDNFDRADTATGLGVTSDGLFTWSTTTRFRISGNKMLGISGASRTVVNVDPGATSYTIQGTASSIPAGTSKDTSLAFRISDANNLWGVYCGGGVSNKWSLMKVNAGAYSFPVTSALTPADGDIVKVVVTPTTLTLFVNGVSQGSVTDSFNGSATQVGFWGLASGVFAYDDFSVV